ncbi:LuxR family quorum-sensing system transcriptional regulator ExpR [Erwinia toletana]|uniref:LuxR family quorum-sensing system transcriptional regulator ExpR n=1 Tax=Winslowiella toletana TaxID=92490 RepID=A0ABS4P4E9_9GAMM|nr:autoinducer binding domain-containing protein [Winslowiella toletana]MBP2167521.1 LuxR family quorum-sensing system transcriptional regulator ExpR [Winslowiella toletana]
MSKVFFENAEKNKYINGVLKNHLGKYRNINYAYGVMSKENTDKMILISDMPDSVVNNYLNEKFQNVDPVIINALNRLSPFAWDENLKT